tara:strand:- start:3113 stop:5008 length:1896 start_codon:yes stop_codon:yes gene_type:complete
MAGADDSASGRLARTMERVRAHEGSDLATTIASTPGSGEQGFVAEAEALWAELGRGTAESPFVLGSPLGEGGTGMVRSALQRSLGRRVAVKTLHGRGRREALALVREALVTGRLEHPNVVPVYDLQLDDEGVPYVALKQVAGVDWAALMRDPETVRERFGAEDLLEWNLRVFVQVCAAVEHAHRRGVLHRDIKPENVLVGEHGEVYLADWGIAVPLDDQGRAQLGDAVGVAGTPFYMAPEMFDDRGPELGTWTDVYLLGATLYEIVAGRPPHEKDTLLQVVHASLASAPVFPEHVSREAAALVRRAMNPDPGRRFASAGTLRRAVEDFLRHRDAARVLAQAEERLEEMAAQMAEGGDERVYDLFGECRFGFRHALELWPEQPAARAGYDRALGLVAERELERGEVVAARGRLRDMQEPPEELATRVEAAWRAAETERRRLEELDRALDPALGRSLRFGVVAVLGVMWIVGPVVGQFLLWWRGPEGLPAWLPLVSSGAFLLLVGGLAWRNRDGIRESAVTRRVVLSVALGVVVVSLSRIVGLLQGSPSPLQLTHQNLLIWTAISGALTFTVDRRIAAATAALALAFVGTAWMGPLSVLGWMAAANAVVFGTGYVLWGRPPKTRTADPEGDRP